MKTQKNKNKQIPNIDANKTLALLIGVTKFPQDNSINGIPNIKQNIKQLKNTLVDKDILGIPDENIIVSLNDSKLEIEKKLTKISREANKHNYTLLIYYSGHGILSSENFKLYLTSTDSTKEYLESDSININRFREIIEYSNASQKIVILDACHSGQIHNSMSDLSSKLNTELKKFEGTYVMTSASEDEPSLFPHDDTKKPTYFTAKLINVLNKGVDNGKPYFSIGDVFKEIYNCFKYQKGLPLPQQSVFQNANEIIISKNNKYNINEHTESEINEQLQTSYSNKRGKMLNDMQNVKHVYSGSKKLNLKKYKIITAVSVFAIIIITAITLYFAKFNNNSSDVLYAAQAMRGDSVYKCERKIVEPINDKQINEKSNTLIQDTESEYNLCMQKAQIFLNADNGENDALEQLNNALILKPNDSIALNKIKEIEQK